MDSGGAVAAAKVGADEGGGGDRGASGTPAPLKLVQYDSKPEFREAGRLKPETSVLLAGNK